MTDRSITIATENDLKFILDLQRKFSNQIGFIPRSKTEFELSKGNFLLGKLNCLDAGFLYVLPGLSCQPETTAIIQAAVRFDAQRMCLGLKLVEQLELISFLRGSLILQASCREDLESNLFWQAAGFSIVGTRPGGKARGFIVNIFRKSLREGVDISVLPIEPRERLPGGRWAKSKPNLDINKHSLATLGSSRENETNARLAKLCLRI